MGNHRFSTFTNTSTYLFVTTQQLFVEFLLPVALTHLQGVGICVTVLFSIGVPWRVLATSYHSDSPLCLFAHGLIRSSPLGPLGDAC